MKYKKVNNYKEIATAWAFISSAILMIPATMLYKRTVISHFFPLAIIICGSVAGLILNSDKVNSLKNFKDAFFINLFAWGLLCSSLFIGLNYFVSIKSTRQQTIPISNRYIKTAKAAIVEVANTKFDYKFRFVRSEMDKIYEADSIAVTFSEGLFGFIVIREYHLISNP